MAFFAENLAECLITQFEAEGIEDEILNQILREHLKDIAAGKSVRSPGI